MRHGFGRFLAVAAGAACLAACGGAPAAPANGAAPAVPSATAEPLFVPVFARDFADPFILPHGGRFVAYATNDTQADINVQVAESSDLKAWSAVPDEDRPSRPRDALPILPAWAKEGSTWAPEVVKTVGGYVLYFTARHRRSGLQCVDAAASAGPLGPFVSEAAEPMVCQFELGGTIDASPFRDRDGKLYLYFKNDGNNPAADKPAQIWGQRLSADGLTLEGEAIALLRNDAAWEGRVVEAPTMARGPHGYAMFYSANDYGWQPHQRLSAYAIGYAACQGPLGPCRDAADNPLLASAADRRTGCLSGPGHQAVFEAAGRLFIAFHAWSAGPGCRRLDHRRHLYIAPLGWEGGKPSIGPSLRPEKEGK